MNWRDKFIDDLGKWWRLASIQLATFGGVLSGAWLACPDSIRNRLPPNVQTYFACVVFALIIFARLIKQPPPPPPPPSEGN